MILHPRGRSGCERRHSADLGFVALLLARWAARNREALTAPRLLRSEEEQMGALQGYLREQSVKTDVHALPVATLRGAGGRVDRVCAGVRCDRRQGSGG